MAPKTKMPVTADANLTDVSVGPQIITNIQTIGKYTIEDRAVPDFRDGCKPSQRRLLYTMYKLLGVRDTGKLVKSARITGTCMGVLHPHADAYDALVGMTHTRYPLVDGTQANFGDLRNPAGAPRYTETRFMPVAMEQFKCLAVAKMVPNYAGDEQEPVVINTRIPLMLMNGASGIAFGMSTNIPSHNLGELVQALVYTARNMDTVTCEDLLQFVKGPDCVGGGIIVSKPAEVAQFYQTGYGKIVYQCTYSFTRTDAGTEILVTEFPDGYSVNELIESCENLRHARTIKSVTAVTEGPRYKKKLVVRIVVDNKTAMERVLKLLMHSESYQFHVTRRKEADVDLLTMNLVSWSKAWIQWRVKEEEKMLVLEEDKALESRHKEVLRLKGIKNIDIVIAAIKQDKVEPAEYLSKHMKITMEDAQFIGAIPVFQLKKVNIDEQRAKIANIDTELKRIGNDLDHLTDVVVRHLEALKPHCDERRTRVGARGPQLSKFETTGDPVIVAASTDGKLFAHLDEKSSTNADLLACGTFNGAVLFGRTGMVCYLTASEMSGKAGPAYKDIVGLGAQEHEFVLGVGVNGLAVRIPMQQRRAEFPIIKATDLLFGCTLSTTSKILAWGAKGEFQIIPCDKIPESSRSNVAGSKFAKFVPIRIAVVHAGESLYSLDGSSVAMSRAQDVEDCMAVGARNVVFLKSGRRKILDMKQTLKFIVSAEVKAMYPVTVPE